MTTPLWTVLPFALLLLSIAIFPLLAPQFWESNRNKSLVSIVLSIPIAVWLLMTVPSELLHTLEEYVSFVILLGALYFGSKDTGTSCFLGASYVASSYRRRGGKF